MDLALLHFKQLTIFSSKCKGINLLQGLKYLDSFYKFHNLLIALEKNKIDYKVVSGYKGTTIFGLDNQFTTCVLRFNNDSDLEKLIKCIDIIVFSYIVKSNQIKISIK